MVAGNFKCIGTSQSIKDKYGYGYEIDLRIELLSEQILSEYIKASNLNSQDVLNDLNQIKNSLCLLSKNEFIYLIEKSKLGIEILEEVRNYLLNF